MFRCYALYYLLERDGSDSVAMGFGLERSYSLREHEDDTY
jgi:hypothetical protein